MPPPISFLSTVCQHVRSFVEAGVDAIANSISVSIGTPAMVTDDTTADQLNLFFYRFEPSGFEAGPHPQDPWRLRIHCLITAMGSGGGEVAGDNDLRMLGNVIRVFHQTPILDPIDVGGEMVRVQAVFIPLTEDQINQVWQAQGDTAYRPSVAYELALAPVVPTLRRGPPPVVGTVGSEARGALSTRFAPFGGAVGSRQLPAHDVDLSDPDWQPLLCWVIGSDCTQTYSHDVDSGPFTPQIWVAGDPTTTVDLVWEEWDSSSGFALVGTTVGIAPFSTGIDPDAVPNPVPASFTQIPPPSLAPALTLAAGIFSGQYLVYAIRTGNSGSRVRSDPLLLTLHRPRP